MKKEMRTVTLKSSVAKVTVKANDRIVHKKLGVLIVKEIYKVNKKKYVVFENVLGERSMASAWVNEQVLVDFIFKVA